MKGKKSICRAFKLSNLPIKFPLKSGQEVIQNIIDETPHEDILKDIENLKKKDKLLFSTLITKCISPNMTKFLP